MDFLGTEGHVPDTGDRAVNPNHDGPGPDVPGPLFVRSRPLIAPSWGRTARDTRGVLVVLLHSFATLSRLGAVPLDTTRHRFL